RAQSFCIGPAPSEARCVEDTPPTEAAQSPFPMHRIAVRAPALHAHGSTQQFADHGSRSTVLDASHAARVRRVDARLYAVPRSRRPLPPKALPSEARKK